MILFAYVPCSNLLSSSNNLFDPQDCLSETCTFHTNSQIRKFKPQETRASGFETHDVTVCRDYSQRLEDLKLGEVSPCQEQCTSA